MSRLLLDVTTRCRGQSDLPVDGRDDAWLHSKGRCGRVARTRTVAAITGLPVVLPGDSVPRRCWSRERRRMTAPNSAKPIRTSGRHPARTIDRAKDRESQGLSASWIARRTRVAGAHRAEPFATRDQSYTVGVTRAARGGSSDALGRTESTRSLKTRYPAGSSVAQALPRDATWTPGRSRSSQHNHQEEDV